MISNADNYLLLKQMLVIIQTLRLQGEVNAGLQNVTEPGATRVVDKCVSEILENFTYPEVLMDNVKTAICFDYLPEMIDTLCSVIPEEHELFARINEINNPDSISNCIYQYPNMDKHVDEHDRYFNDNVFWGETRKVGIDLVASLTNAIKSVNAWATESDGRPMVQLIVLVNCIEMLDRLFTFVNDKYGVDDVVSQ